MFFQKFATPAKATTADEKIMKLMENNNALLICSEKFYRDSNNEFLVPGTHQNNFVKKIHDATAVKLNNNPLQSLWRATQSEILQGSLNICSARVDDKHRVLFIAKYSTILNKIVIYLLEDDPQHKYNLDKINASYQSKNRSCGSKEDWFVIFEVVHNQRYAQLQFQTALKPKKELPSSSFIIKLPSRSVESLHSEPQEAHVPSQVLSASEKTGIKSSEKKEDKFEVPPSELVAEPREQEKMPESKTEAAVIEKKKKKKKPSGANFVSEQTIAQTLQAFLQSGTTEFSTELYKLFTMQNKNKCLKIVSGLLNLGMNPEMIGLNGTNLLRCAIMEQHIEVVKLLLDWDVDLLVLNPNGELIEQLTIAIANRDHIEIIKALVQKTKGKGKLDDRLINFSEITFLHLAALSGNAEAVQVLLDSGANPKVTDAGGLDPLANIHRLFSRDWKERAIYLAQARGLKPRKFEKSDLLDDKKVSQLLNPPDARDNFAPMNPLEKREYNAIKNILRQKILQQEAYSSDGVHLTVSPF